MVSTTIGPLEEDGRKPKLHPELAGPKDLGLEALDPKAFRQHIMSGKTEFGRFIRPVVEKLAALGDAGEKESMQTLDIVYKAIKGREKELSQIEFTREDSLFMVTDKIGNLLRRPVIHTHFAQKMEDELTAVEPDEKALKSVFIKGLRANAWSRFVAEEAGIQDQIKAKYPDEEVFVDFMENAKGFEEATAKVPVYSYGMVREAVGHAGEFYAKYAKPLEAEYDAEREQAGQDKDKRAFLTDPGHAYGVKADLNLYDVYSDLSTHDYTMISRMELVREASFMLVEDNPTHTLWTRLLGKVGNLSYYKPPAGSESKAESARAYEDRGVYSNAERALEVMDAAGKPPDVLLSDIELGSGMNGIELVRKLHKERPDAIILMVYSSNPGAYDLESLKKEGVISGAWDKKNFKPHDMIKTINEELGKRKI
ncbi:response regulator transcription factor [Candidatus Altiarchaeota archaeon]